MTAKDVVPLSRPAYVAPGIFDVCGDQGNNEIDGSLVNFPITERIPATLLLDTRGHGATHRHRPHSGTAAGMAAALPKIRAMGFTFVHL